MSGHAGVVAEAPRLMVRTTMKLKGKPASSVDTEFFSLATAVKFAGVYMTGIAAKEHADLEWIRFELPPAKSTSKATRPRRPTRKTARKR